MKPKKETLVFQPRPDFRVEVQVADYGTNLIVNIEFSGQPDPALAMKFYAWYAPIHDRCYEKPSTTYFNGSITYTWPIGDGNWGTYILNLPEAGPAPVGNPWFPPTERSP